MAGRLNTDWFVVHVESRSESGHRIDATLQRYLLEDEQRARDLGAEVVRLKSDAPVKALLNSAAIMGFATLSSGVRINHGGAVC